MTLVPTTFPAPPEAAIATFDAAEFADGTGTTILLAAVNEDSVSENFMLTKQAVWSSKIETVAIVGTVTTNFDSAPFNLPKTAKGTAYVNIGYAPTAGANLSFAVQVQKWDGTTATDISSEITSPTFTGSNVQTLALLEIPLTQTIIKKGEQLRLVIKMISNSTSHAMGHDPQNRDGTIIIPSSGGVTTVLTFLMSFDINL